MTPCDALLALLALRRGCSASVEALIDDLWSSDMPASPRNAVQHHFARLGAALGQDAIVGTPNGYAVADATTDALVFEDLLVEARAALRDGDPRTAGEAYQSARRVRRDRGSWATETNSPRLQNRRDELGRVLDQLCENLRRAEDLYESACGAFEGIAPPPAPPAAAVVRLAS